MPCIQPALVLGHFGSSNLELYKPAKLTMTWLRLNGLVIEDVHLPCPNCSLEDLARRRRGTDEVLLGKVHGTSPSPNGIAVPFRVAALEVGHMIGLFSNTEFGK